MDQIWPNLGQILSKQPILKVETQDFDSESNHHSQCIYKNIWAYTSDKMGQMDQIWVQFGPNRKEVDKD